MNVGVALLVYALDEGVGRRIESVETSWTGFGPLWIGNKAAVGVRFTVKAERKEDSDEIFTYVGLNQPV